MVSCKFFHCYSSLVETIPINREDFQLIEAISKIVFTIRNVMLSGLVLSEVEGKHLDLNKKALRQAQGDSKGIFEMACTHF